MRYISLIEKKRGKITKNQTFTLEEFKDKILNKIKINIETKMSFKNKVYNVFDLLFNTKKINRDLNENIRKLTEKLYCENVIKNINNTINEDNIGKTKKSSKKRK